MYFCIMCASSLFLFLAALELSHLHPWLYHSRSHHGLAWHHHLWLHDPLLLHRHHLLLLLLLLHHHLLLPGLGSSLLLCESLLVLGSHHIVLSLHWVLDHLNLLDSGHHLLLGHRLDLVRRWNWHTLCLHLRCHHWLNKPRSLSPVSHLLLHSHHVLLLYHGCVLMHHHLLLVSGMTSHHRHHHGLLHCHNWHVVLLHRLHSDLILLRIPIDLSTNTHTSNLFSLLSNPFQSSCISFLLCLFLLLLDNLQLSLLFSQWVFSFVVCPKVRLLLFVS